MAWPGSATGIVWGMGCLLLGVASVGRLDAPASPDLDLPEQPLRRIFERVSPSPAALLAKQPAAAAWSPCRAGASNDWIRAAARRGGSPSPMRTDVRARGASPRFTSTREDTSGWAPSRARSSSGTTPPGCREAPSAVARRDRSARSRASANERWLVGDALWRLGPEGIWMRVPLPTLGTVDAFAAHPEAGVLAASGGRVWRYDAAGWRAIWRSTGTTPDVLCLAPGSGGECLDRNRRRPGRGRRQRGGALVAARRTRHGAGAPRDGRLRGQRPAWPGDALRRRLASGDVVP